MASPDMPIIWVIDDDPDVAVHLRIRLDRLGVATTVRAIPDGVSARAALAEAAVRPALVVLDHFLPDEPGSGLVVAVREAAPGVPVVMSSAAPDEVPAEVAAGLEVLAKPIDAERVQALVSAAAGAG